MYDKRSDAGKKQHYVPGISIANGVTQPVFDYKACLFEKVYVETPLDTDGDGRRDLVAVYVRRPAETLQGMKAPAIYVANPYMMGCNEDWYSLCDVDKDLKVYKPQSIIKEDVTFQPLEISEIGTVKSPNGTVLPPERKPKGLAERADTEEIPLECITEWYRYFNTRGYASVFCGGLGTRGSDGFNCTGSQEETVAFTAVIDWLNGRRKAYTNKTDNIEIKADWCTGKVAMTGKSYLGTMCIAAAVTGVEGLTTIIPEAAISSWYRYFRQNGLTVSCEGWQGDDIHLLTKYCFSRRFDEEDYKSVKKAYEKSIDEILQKSDRDSGNYNRFWDERNYLNSVSKIKASVFVVHGLNDWNVKPDQCALFWRELTKYNIPRKMILHQGDHIYIYDQQSIDFNGIMHRWLDYWLYGIENGVMETVPNVLVQSNLDQNKWIETTAWPPESVKDTIFPLSYSSSGKNTFTDDLTLTGYDREKNNLAQWRKELVSEPKKDKPYRLVYLISKLKKDMRISGNIQVSLQASLDQGTGILSTMLVDYGQNCRLSLEREPVEKGGINLGKNAGSIDTVQFVKEKEPSAYRIISRGFINVQNRKNSYCKEEVIPGEMNEFTIDMISMDYTVKAGHELGLILYSTDAEFTQRPYQVTNFKIKEDTVVVKIPVV